MNERATDSNYSKLREESRVNLVQASPLAAPMAIYIETTNICNFRCVYCPESFPDFAERSGGLHKMDVVSFASIAEQIKRLGKLKVLNFYMMGEPFANPSLCEFISHATQLQIAERTCVTTNGTLLRGKTIDGILSMGLDYLRVSIYGGTPESFARRTASTFPLQRIVENVKSLRNQRDALSLTKPHIYVKMIDTLDAEENATFLSLFQNIADEVVLEPAMNWNDPEQGNLAQLSSEEMLQTSYFRHKKKACPFPFYTLVIHSDLRVSVCCVDWEKKGVVGDLKKQSLAEIWNGQLIHEFRLAHLKGERNTLPACARCTYLYTTPDNVDELSPRVYLARCPSVLANTSP